MRTMYWWGLGRSRETPPPVFLIRQKSGGVWFETRRKTFTKRSAALAWLRRHLRNFLSDNTGSGHPDSVTKETLDEAVSHFEVVEFSLTQANPTPQQATMFTRMQEDDYRDGFHAGLLSHSTPNPHPLSNFERFLWWHNGYEDAGREDRREGLLYPELRRGF